MTVNAYIFSWDQTGVEAIIPITQYEEIDKENLLQILREEPQIENPLGNIITMLKLRAHFNQQRHYEIYAIDCTPEMNEEFWREQWDSYPQATANLIRDRGHCIHSDRQAKSTVRIV